jgi:formyl-CoA transferase
MSTDPRFKRGPLSDLRVIEMGTLLAGPFCGQLLGDMGAEVIKIEPPGQGDPMRVWGRQKAGEPSLWWPVVARNKKAITLDLTFYLRISGLELWRNGTAVMRNSPASTRG